MTLIVLLTTGVFPMSSQNNDLGYVMVAQMPASVWDKCNDDKKKMLINAVAKKYQIEHCPECIVAEVRVVQENDMIYFSVRCTKWCM